MNLLRYIQIALQGPVNVVSVATQIHFLLTPGEGANPESAYWDLTAGGLEIGGGIEGESICFLSSERVTFLSRALQSESWEALEARAKSNLDLLPGWHEGLQPEFERLCNFFAEASERRCSVIRVTPGGGFLYR